MQPFCVITSAAGKVSRYTSQDQAFDMIERAVAFSPYPIVFVGVIGSRRRNSDADRDIVHQAMRDIIREAYDAGERVVFVSGACPQGGDRFCREFCLAERYDLIEFPAQWDLLGKRAGFARNEHIARWSHELIALVAPDRTGGTEDTIRHFERLHPNIAVTLL